MQAIVITGGDAPPPATIEAWCADADLIIAADSGLDTIRQTRCEPDLIVGDFDSISDAGILADYNQKVRRFPGAKDFTDTELALRAARERGATKTVLLGGGGGRADHLLGHVVLFERDEHPSVWVTAREVVMPVRGDFEASGEVGDVISFFPLGADVCRMTSSGLRWPLDNLEWSRGDMGISNEFVTPTVRVKMVSGRLLAIRPYEPAP